MTRTVAVDILAVPGDLVAERMALTTGAHVERTILGMLLLCWRADADPSKRRLRNTVDHRCDLSFQILRATNAGGELLVDLERRPAVDRAVADIREVEPVCAKRGEELRWAGSELLRGELIQELLE